MSIVKVGLCGHGYWGQNLLRTFSSDPRFEVVPCPTSGKARREVWANGATIRLYGDGTEVIDREVAAVAIATPAATPLSPRAPGAPPRQAFNGAVGLRIFDDG